MTFEDEDDDENEYDSQNRTRKMPATAAKNVPALPTGILTFVFTDIEGSTRLWDEHPDAMKQAHARHMGIITSSVESHNGVVVRSRGEGDSTFAVFTHAPDAVRAVVAFQKELESEPWPEGVRLKVRVAMHTGSGEITGRDYNSTDVNRCARLRGIGAGGQILLTRATFDGVRDNLPDGVTLKDLGCHRLKDLKRAEQVFQVSHADLPDEFPPLRSLDSFPNNLPRQVTSFIGRDKEMEEVKRLLTASPLVTIQGAGGCGKTRLSIQVAANILDQFPDGAWVVELAPISDPALVPQVAANALGVREEPKKPLIDTLCSYLESRTLLLVIDNCEHLIDASARLAEAILQDCPGVKIIATSRERLRIAGENAWRLPSLAVPASGGHPLARTNTASTVEKFDAVRLFVERAQTVAPSFSVSTQNAADVTQICRRLDGIPLAIELAAARVNVLTVDQIAQRLDDRFSLLTTGHRTALPRQQTLTALIDWSYDLLSNDERTLLARLSVFAGGWTLEAAERVCGSDELLELVNIGGPTQYSSAQPLQDSQVRRGLPSRQSSKPRRRFERLRRSEGVRWSEGLEGFERLGHSILDLLTQLVDKSLVVAEEHEDGVGRYRLLETLRQYGRVKLDKSGETDATRARHTAYYLSVVEEAEPNLVGPEQVAWFEKLETEHDNLRAALEFCSKVEADQPGQVADVGLRLAGSLSRFWFVRGYFVEGREWISTFLNLADGRTRERGRALTGFGRLALNQWDRDAARSSLEEALSIQEELGDGSGAATSLLCLGVLSAEAEDYHKADDLFERSLSLNRELGDHRGASMALINLANTAIFQKRWARARTLLDESLAVSTEISDTHGIATSLNNLGHVASMQEDFSSAHAYFMSSLALCKDLGFKAGIADCTEELAKLAAKQSLPHRASLLFAAADNLREELNLPLPPGERQVCDEHLAVVRTLMDDKEFEQAWSEGQALTLDQAVAYALDDAGTPVKR